MMARGRLYAAIALTVASYAGGCWSTGRLAYDAVVRCEKPWTQGEHDAAQFVSIMWPLLFPAVLIDWALPCPVAAPPERPR